MAKHGEVASRIWKTVVFAGAMLGAPGCHSSKPPAAPSNDAPKTEEPLAKPDPAPEPTAKPDSAAQTPTTPAADPCAGAAAPDPTPPPPAKRPRGTSSDRPKGRGFVLA